MTRPALGPLGELLPRLPAGVAEQDPATIARLLAPAKTGRLPRAVLLPASEEELRAILVAASTAGCPLAGWPDRAGTPVVWLSRLDAIGPVNGESRLVTTRTGVDPEALEARLTSDDRSIGLMPGQTAGLPLAVFLSGHRSLDGAMTFGPLRSRIASVRAVLADGRVVETTHTPRAATGPSLRQLLLDPASGAWPVAVALRFHLLSARTDTRLWRISDPAWCIAAARSISAIPFEFLAVRVVIDPAGPVVAAVVEGRPETAEAIGRMVEERISRLPPGTAEPLDSRRKPVTLDLACGEAAGVYGWLDWTTVRDALDGRTLSSGCLYHVTPWGCGLQGRPAPGRFWDDLAAAGRPIVVSRAGRQRRGRNG